jgi:Transglycosylase SLT domain
MLLIAISICMTAKEASAEELGGIIQPHQAPAARSNGAPVLSEAENASQDASSATVAPVITNRVDPNARESDRNCQALVSAAVAHNVPVDFFVRLIRQESNFDPYSVSHKGAQGIAQFMPGTARWRGLADPFEPEQALQESARWLGELRAQFGNLGLAAAAYNAGPRRVLEWLGGRGNLPGETRAYVRIITGRPVEEWALGNVDEPLGSPRQLPCEQLMNGAPVQPGITVTIRERTVSGPWGLQLIGNWSESQALSDYKALQKRFQAVLGDRPPMVIKSRMAGRGSAPWYLIRVAQSTRDQAKQLCSRLEALGGSCLVFRN